MEVIKSFVTMHGARYGYYSGKDKAYSKKGNGNRVEIQYRCIKQIKMKQNRNINITKK